MTHTVDRPKVDERIVKAPPPTPAPQRAGFVRWLGWVLVAALVLGGAGLIWYTVSNDSAIPAPGLTADESRALFEQGVVPKSAIPAPGLTADESRALFEQGVVPKSAIPAPGLTADESRALFEQGTGG